MARLLLHILIWALSVWGLGVFLRAWANRNDLHIRQFRWVGIAGMGILLLLPILWRFGLRRFPWSLPQDLLPRWIEFRALQFGGLLLLLLLLWQTYRTISEIARAHKLRRTSWDEVRGFAALRSGDEDLADWERLRLKLENRLSADANQPITLRFSSHIQLPFTIGFREPEVYAPLWLTYEDEGAHTLPLLQHEREHVRLGHHRWATVFTWMRRLIPWLEPFAAAMKRSMEVECDRKLIQAANEDSRSRYLTSLQRVVGAAAGSGPEIGLGHDRSRVPQRIEQCQTAPRYPQNKKNDR